MSNLLPHLVIFARRPRLGEGKRRLARDIGNTGALWFQRRAIAMLKRELGGDPRWRPWIAATPAGSAGWTAPFQAIQQGGGDLGMRLNHVLDRLPRAPVIVIGSDAPHVRAQDIADALAALRRHDAVAGPACDGGFWLIGLRRPDRLRPFSGVRWSTSHTLDDVRRNLSGHRTAFLRPLEDVDDGESLRRFRQRPSATTT
ncbi:TIGR04282 family arsenosugar biosynthesis glycosyltransferase [Novosphingobium beihaiensis]|uniref:Glycosyltransferase n=1 Tax=Novosphingobium beihaiensis TaxID=2930389 RepID=A0ABT0BLA1_9SPHN|nr:TIGR04282 family arsenosugar biosynthesis glycosyltransferase [Novosphingobium beihaiensis]MCJ2185817.1 glycosyltransferase [Novosphingobium beihaiensis]